VLRRFGGDLLAAVSRKQVFIAKGAKDAQESAMMHNPFASSADPRRPSR
jgi:hypothetical protein